MKIAHAEFLWRVEKRERADVEGRNVFKFVVKFVY